MLGLGLAVRDRDAPALIGPHDARLRITSLTTTAMRYKRLPVHVKQVCIQLLLVLLLCVLEAGNLVLESQVVFLLVVLVARAWTRRAAPASIRVLLLGRAVLHLRLQERLYLLLLLLQDCLLFNQLYLKNPLLLYALRPLLCQVELLDKQKTELCFLLLAHLVNLDELRTYLEVSFKVDLVGSNLVHIFNLLYFVEQLFKAIQENLRCNLNFMFFYGKLVF